MSKPQSFFEWSRIADVPIDAGDRARKLCSRTPLDFLKSPPANTSIVAPFWFGLGVVFNFDKESCSRPLKRFGNCKTRPAAGITTREIIYGVLFEAIYFGAHLFSWNQLFPTQAEFYLWRVSNFVLLGLLAAYLIAIPIGVVSSRPFSRRWPVQRSVMIYNGRPRLYLISMTLLEQGAY